jgi:uncharacterized protein
MAAEVAVRDVPERHRYEATVEGRLAGFAEYRDRDGVRIFTHTEVFDAFEGQGVGSALASGALDAVDAGDGRIVALCPFIAAYIGRHPEYEALVDQDLDRELRG